MKQWWGRNTDRKKVTMQRIKEAIWDGEIFSIAPFSSCAEQSARSEAKQMETTSAYTAHKPHVCSSTDLMVQYFCSVLPVDYILRV